VIKRSTFAILPLIILLSCDKVMPGGFWDKFEQDLRIEKQSDQGPWGGTRIYYWKSSAEGFFTKEKVINITSANEWELVDSIGYQEKQFQNWQNNGKPTFIIEVGPFEPPTDESFLREESPRWTNSDLTLYKFKTGWIILYPRTDSSTEVNGFITLSKDGTEMTVYHLWRE
jgi:hypothetical protein